MKWLADVQLEALPYLTGKPIGLVSTAGGAQGLQAVNSMDFIARAARVHGAAVSVPAAASVPVPGWMASKTRSSPRVSTGTR